MVELPVEELLTHLNDPGNEWDWEDLGEAVEGRTSFTQAEVDFALDFARKVGPESGACMAIYYILSSSDKEGKLLNLGAARALRSEAPYALSDLVRFVDHLPKILSREFCDAFGSRKEKRSAWIYLFGLLKLNARYRRSLRALARVNRIGSTFEQ